MLESLCALSDVTLMVRMALRQQFRDYYILLSLETE